MTHQGSGWEEVYETLISHPRIQGVPVRTYRSREEVIAIARAEHKLDNAAAIYLGVIAENSQLQRRDLLRDVSCLFLLRDPEESLPGVVSTDPVSHLLMRYKRLAQLSQSTRGLVVTRGEIGAKLGLIRDHWQLKEPFALTLGDPASDRSPCESLRPAYEECLRDIRRSLG